MESSTTRFTAQLAFRKQSLLGLWGGTLLALLAGCSDTESSPGTSAEAGGGGLSSLDAPSSSGSGGDGARDPHASPAMGGAASRDNEGASSDTGGSGGVPGSGGNGTGGDTDGHSCPVEAATADAGLHLGVVRVEFTHQAESGLNKATIWVRNFGNVKASFSTLIAANQQSGGANWWNGVPRSSDQLAAGDTLRAPLVKPLVPVAGGELALFDELSFDAMGIASYVRWATTLPTVEKTLTTAATKSTPVRWADGDAWVAVQSDSVGIVAVGNIADPKSWVPYPEKCRVGR